jgi:hypothetical protein
MPTTKLNKNAERLVLTNKTRRKNSPSIKENIFINFEVLCSQAFEITNGAMIPARLMKKLKNPTSSIFPKYR